MADVREALLRQFDLAWKLCAYHLDGLSTAECLWRPAAKGLHLHQEAGGWRADWPESEGYEIGPPSIGWLTWHLLYWLSSAHDHAFGAGTLARADVRWPGGAEAARAEIERLAAAWRADVAALGGEDLASPARTRWPYRDRPFADVVAWANIELAKNASEIGYARFLYAVRQS